jgi:hypothetical protein
MVSFVTGSQVKVTKPVSFNVDRLRVLLNTKDVTE